MSLVTRKHIRSDEGEGGIGPGEGTVARYIMENNTKAHEAMGTTGQNQGQYLPYKTREILVTTLSNENQENYPNLRKVLEMRVGNLMGNEEQRPRLCGTEYREKPNTMEWEGQTKDD